MFTTRRVVVVSADREAAAMLHTFFRLMELECSLVAPDGDVISTIRRVLPDAAIVDLDLPNLRAFELAREIARATPALPLIFITDDDPRLVGIDGPVLPKPYDRFESLLTLFEAVLESTWGE